MGSDGLIRQTVGIAIPVMSVVTTSVMRWADQEVLFDSREDEELAVEETANTVRSGIVAKKATRSIQTAIAHTAQRAKLIEAWTSVVKEIGQSTLTGRQLVGQNW